MTKPNNSSYDHRIERGLFHQRLVSTCPGPREYRRVEVRAKQVPHWNDRHRLIWDPWCNGPRCPNEPAFTASYQYVTGQSGRTTRRDLHYCREHAERFATRHDLVVPTNVPPDEKDSNL